LWYSQISFPYKDDLAVKLRPLLPAILAHVPSFPASLVSFMNSYLSRDDEALPIKPASSLKEWLSPLLEDDGDEAIAYFMENFPPAVLLHHIYEVHVIVSQYLSIPL